MTPTPKQQEQTNDEILKAKLAEAIGCEWMSDENGFEGYDWFYQEPETGALYATGCGAEQLEHLVAIVEAAVLSARIDELNRAYKAFGAYKRQLKTNLPTNDTYYLRDRLSELEAALTTQQKLENGK